MKVSTTNFSVKLLKTALFVLILYSPLIVRSQSVPLPNAFAHNDYRHRHPLYDALENGYTNIEADIFLEHGELIVAHHNPLFRSSKTLEKLYFKPLLAHIEKNNGRVFEDYSAPVILMIDIKTNADETYKTLKLLLEKYKGMLTGYDNGKINAGAITIVLSGHKPIEALKGEQKRLAFIDEDLRNTGRDTTGTTMYTLSSCKYSKLLKWKGDGVFNTNERSRLCSYIARAHKYGRKVRLWASPEKSNVWEELLKCGVDMINTDKLSTLKNFLKSYRLSNDAAGMMITSAETLNN